MRAFGDTALLWLKEECLEILFLFQDKHAEMVRLQNSLITPRFNVFTPGRVSSTIYKLYGWKLLLYILLVRSVD